MSSYGGLSYWHATAGEPLLARPVLSGDTQVDVCVIGAGYTGLWAAYYLADAEPSLRILVLDAEIAGFGASGRNGGWCSALFAASLSKLARASGRAGALAMHRAMVSTVGEVGRVAQAEGIDCDYAKGGTVVLARTDVQLARARGEVAEARSFGVDEADLLLLSAGQARERLAAEDVLGGTYTPHCAAIHPARLVRGLARVVERRGVRIAERTPAVAVQPGQVRTPYGTVRADLIVRATEGYTAALPGHRREVAPVYSLMLATEPLSAEAWDSIGLRDRETFADHRHLIIYGQRTADGRLVFGGRGAPYHFGSRVRASYDVDASVHDGLRQVLGELLPVTRSVGITHRWGGPLGIPRDWFPSVRFDRASGLAVAGGYVGDGVGSSNLAGRTLADLLLRRDTALTRLPWVGHRSRRWEPEPLRWLGINAGLRTMGSADSEEIRTGRPSRRAQVMARFIGG